MGYFQHIYERFGAATTSNMRQFSNVIKRKASAVNRRIFLMECRRQGLTPRFIIALAKNIDNLPQEMSAGRFKALQDMKKMVTKRLINICINDTNNTIRNLDTMLTIMSNNISRNIPPEYHSEQRAKFKFIIPAVFSNTLIER